MITFVLAAAVLVGALFVAVAVATTEAPPDIVAHVLAARLLATDQTVPVSLLLDTAEAVGEPRTLARAADAMMDFPSYLALALALFGDKSLGSGASTPSTCVFGCTPDHIPSDR
jgi:hypothetical protein